jgi:hypothetical protein
MPQAFAATGALSIKDPKKATRWTAGQPRCLGEP